MMSDIETTADIVLIVGFIIISGASQFILFLPKVLGNTVFCLTFIQQQSEHYTIRCSHTSLNL